MRVSRRRQYLNLSFSPFDILVNKICLSNRVAEWVPRCVSILLLKLCINKSKNRPSIALQFLLRIFTATRGEWLCCSCLEKKKKKSKFAGPSLQPHICHFLETLLVVYGTAVMTGAERRLAPGVGAVSGSFRKVSGCCRHKDRRLGVLWLSLVFISW